MRRGARATRWTFEDALADGARFRAGVRDGAQIFEIVPRRTSAIPRLALAIGWVLLMAAMVASLVHGRGFLFLPIVIVPFKRFYRSLCASFNRLGFTLDRTAHRFRFRQGPLPCARAVELALLDVRSFREVELDEYVGAWFPDLDARRWWSVRIAMREGGSCTLPVRLDAIAARRIAAALNDAVDASRSPRAYRS